MQGIIINKLDGSGCTEMYKKDYFYFNLGNVPKFVHNQEVV